MLKSKKAGCSSYANVTDDYILYNKATKPVSGGVKKGKKAKKGGSTDLLSSVSSLPKAFDDVSKAIKGGKGGCNSCGSRGGAVELAPFAASLAFLAARMAIDKELNFKKLMGKVTKTSKSASSRKSPTSRKSKSA